MTKIDIISGFLGAGKTTLIKKLLAEAYQGEQLVLIENEFGESPASWERVKPPSSRNCWRRPTRGKSWSSSKTSSARSASTAAF